MWSDGSEQDSANFAADSGLDWQHCCVKVEVDMTSYEVNQGRYSIDILN